MANDFNVNEFKLKDPVRAIPDGLKEPIKDATPGFFKSLRSPLDLMLEESLPASLYQWMTGNTKKKQAQEALNFIRRNPRMKGTKLYSEAERKLNRWGYLLDDGPMSIDLKEIKNMVKANPKLFGAELVNMIMADPWLLFVPLGWHRLGRGVVNSIRLKNSKKLKLIKDTPGKYGRQAQLKMAAKRDIKVGAMATLAVPFVFSTSWQLGEKAEFDPKRTGIETTIGATAGAVFSVGFAGISAAAQRLTRVPKVQVNTALNKVFENNKLDPSKLVEYNSKGHFKSVDELLKQIRRETGRITDEAEFNRIATEITAAMRAPIENGVDMAKNTLLKATTIGGVVGAAEFLTSKDEKLLATATGFGVGVGLYAAAKGLGKLFSNTNKVWDDAALRAESGLDTAKFITVRYNSLAQELSNKIKDTLPDALDSRKKVFYYITRAKVDENFKYNSNVKPINWNELSQAEKISAKALRKIFDEYEVIFGKEGANLVFNKRSNYLPLIWNEYPGKELIKFTTDFENKVYGPSGKFQFTRRGVFQEINNGLQKGFTIRPGMDDPAELVRLYAFAAGKALTTKQLINYLSKQNINRTNPFIASSKKQVGYIDPRERVNYVAFDHPYFAREAGFTPLVHKGIERSLRMVFDATEETALMSALFTTNFMMKRLAVGFSFFHAGALVESLWFAGAKPTFIKKVLDPRSKPELLKMVKDPSHYVKEFDHAVSVLREQGYDDIVRFSQGSGLQLSIPEDTGFDRFYYNVRNVDSFLKRNFGISSNRNVERTFRWFDAITWDRIFTSAKIHTFLSSLDKSTIMGRPNPNRIMPGDTQQIIYRKARAAAQFTNDAFGGQNWEQLAARIQTPWLKRLAQTTFTPGSRGYMQLLLFAPDWTISNLRIIAKSMPGFESDPAMRRLYQYYFARAALTYAAAGSVLNYIFSGHSILENTDPTRIDLGDGEVLTFSKQLMEPFHWITAPQATGLKKIGSLPRVVIETLTNKQYLTTKWSPNITKKDDEAIEKGLKIGGHVGRRFMPIWLQTASQNVAKGLERDGLSADLAADTAVDFVLGQLGHPRYKGPRTSQYKTKGLVRSPYETLF